jgi:hypothetical protein
MGLARASWARRMYRGVERTAGIPETRLGRTEPHLHQQEFQQALKFESHWAKQNAWYSGGL